MDIEADAPGLGIVQDGVIPYKAEARVQQQDNLQFRLERDPAVKCWMPGVPRATYMPHPFQIVQSDGDPILLAYEFARASRTVHMDAPDVAPPIDSWMGYSVGSWEGDTLVIDVTRQVTDTWLDSAGNHHGASLHVVERYTPVSPNHLMYEATIDDPDTYTRPWRIRLPLYRRIDDSVQLAEFQCQDFAEELLYGHLITRPSLTLDQMSVGDAYGSAESRRVRDFFSSFVARHEMRSPGYIAEMYHDNAILTVDKERVHGFDAINTYYVTLFDDATSLAIADIAVTKISNTEWRITGDYTSEDGVTGAVTAFCVDDGSLKFITVTFEPTMSKEKGTDDDEDDEEKQERK